MIDPFFLLYDYANPVLRHNCVFDELYWTIRFKNIDSNSVITDKTLKKCKYLHINTLMNTYTFQINYSLKAASNIKQKKFRVHDFIRFNNRLQYFLKCLYPNNLPPSLHLHL